MSDDMKKALAALMNVKGKYETIVMQINSLVKNLGQLEELSEPISHTVISLPKKAVHSGKPEHKKRECMRYTEDVNKKIVELVNAGHPYIRIAREIGTTPGAIGMQISALKRSVEWRDKIHAKRGSAKSAATADMVDE